MLLLAFPALAEDAYKFHLTKTDGRTGLLANPRFSELRMSQEQLDRAAKDQVMVLDHTTGAHWVWLMLSWKVDVEQAINDRGSGIPGKDADLSLTPLQNGKVRVRCYREQCRVHASKNVTLKKGESKDFSVDSDFEIAFSRR